MKIAIKGHLNKFYDEGQYNLPLWIVNYISDNGEISSTSAIYQAIQDSSLSNGEKDLSKEQINDMINWMFDKIINNQTLVKSNDDLNTYTYTEVFGCDNKYDVDGIDNGDGTRTISLEGWKPDGSQIRWGFVTVTHPDAAFSAINAILGTFTGRKGETYNLLLSCLIGGEWKTKTFDIRFNS